MTKNTLAQVVSYTIQMVSRFIFLIVIGRLAGVENVGDFSFVVTYTTAFTFLTDCGLGWLLNREVARHREAVGRYVGNAFIVTVVMGGVSMGIMGLIINLLGYSPHLVRAIYIGSLSLVFETLSDLLRAAFCAYERMELETASLLAQDGTFLVGGTLVLILGIPFIWVFGAYLASRVLGWAVTCLIYRRAIGPVCWRFDWPFCRQQIIRAFPFAVNIALSVVYVRIDVLMLSYWHGSTAVGYYEAATNLALRLNILARVFVASLTPMMNRAYLKSALEVRRYARVTVRYLALLSLPLTVGTWMLAGPIIALLYGLEAFAPSVLVLQILSSMTVLRFLDTTLSTTLTAVDRQGWRTLCVTIAAVANVLLNLALLPRYSFIGASMATVLTEVIFFVSQYLFLQRSVPEVIQLAVFWRPTLATMAMAGLLWLWRDGPVWVLVPLAASVYVGVLFALRTFSAQEQRLMWRLPAAVGAMSMRWLRR